MVKLLTKENIAKIVSESFKMNLDLICKHIQYFGKDTLNSYLDDYISGKINNIEFYENVYKDVSDYESCL